MLKLIKILKLVIKQLYVITESIHHSHKSEISNKTNGIFCISLQPDMTNDLYIIKKKLMQASTSSETVGNTFNSKSKIE